MTVISKGGPGLRLRLPVFCFLTLVCVLASQLPVRAHEPWLSREVLESFFPEAENFVTRRKVLSPAEIRQVEQLSGDQVQELDRNLMLYVAVARDPSSGRYRSIGAVVMVDAQGPRGVVDLTVGYQLDGRVRKVMITGNEDDPAVSATDFLRQFEGRGPQDGWDPDRDFRLVGNRTTARAVILAVRRGMYLMRVLVGG